MAEVSRPQASVACLALILGLFELIVRAVITLVLGIFFFFMAMGGEPWPMAITPYLWRKALP